MLNCRDTRHSLIVSAVLVRRPIFVFVALIVTACSDRPESGRVEQVDVIASEFLQGYYSQFPEEVYEVGYPDAPVDRFGDHSEQSLFAWHARVDAWLRALDAIDPDSLQGTPAALTYAFTRERLHALVARRICRMQLWNVSPTWTGWQYMFAGTLAVQPVDSAAERAAALRRAGDIARYLQTEITNLRSGQDLGYVAPQSNVTAVIDQVTTLIETPSDDSPFFSPAARSGDAEFVAEYRQMLESVLIPAFVEYRDYLADEYVGRNVIGVGANPNGEACYAASVRFWSSMSIDPAAIHRLGLSQMSRIQSEMLEIAKMSFGTENVRELLQELRTNPEYTFESEDAILEYVTAAVERARIAVQDWFKRLPDAELIVIPSPAYEKDSGGGFYSSGTADGSRPGRYQVGTYNPRGISKAGQEATAFHESYPGHHLEGSMALVNDKLHPIFRYTYVSGFSEGWALYSERLADEMGLYSSDVARLGMLSNEAYRAARLVVDPGMHVFGWSRQQAIEYMLEHTAEGIDAISGEVDRYAAVPGQATSYLLGSLEIQRLRKQAEDRLGEAFDIREFHDRVLRNGSITLPMLVTSIEAWIATQ